MHKPIDYTVKSQVPIRDALEKLNNISTDAILFVIEENGKLIGSLTDGDVRRGFLKGLNLNDLVGDFSQPNPKVILQGDFNIRQVVDFRNGQFKVVPIIDETGCVINVINFRHVRSYLPIDVVIMAGGRGNRLKPLTNDLPKPLLEIGDKPIMEHNLDRLRKFGISDFWVSIGYKGEMIKSYFKNGVEKQVNIQYVKEKIPLGTVGAVRSIANFTHDYILITNSDLLTTLDYEDFFLDFLDKNADMSVATIPYSVDVPYAVMETTNNHVVSFKEKPTFTYYSNAGIYLIKKEFLKMIPENTFYNSTDLMEAVIAKGLTLVSYPIRGYWLDIGKHEDFEKAKLDINYLEL